MEAGSPSIRPYAGLERFGAAGSELHHARWNGGFADFGGGVVAQGGQDVDAADVQIASDAREHAEGVWLAPDVLPGPPISPLPRVATLREAATDADVRSRVVRVRKLLDQLAAVSPKLQRLVHCMMPVTRAVWRMALRPALCILLAVVETVLRWLLNKVDVTVRIGSSSK